MGFKDTMATLRGVLNVVVRCEGVAFRDPLRVTPHGVGSVRVSEDAD